MLLITRKEAISQGLKRYYTGKPCSNGHVAERYVSGWNCCICNQYSAVNWARKNADAAKQISKKYRLANLVVVSERHKKWVLQNPGYYKSRAETHRKEMSEATKKYRSKNKQAILALNRNRRSRLKGALGSHTRDDVTTILKNQNFRCAECRTNIRYKFHVDHIMPLALGGGNDRKNLQCLCPTCNITKNAKHPIDWAREKGRLL